VVYCSSAIYSDIDVTLAVDTFSHTMELGYLLSTDYYYYHLQYSRVISVTGSCVLNKL